MRRGGLACVPLLLLLLVSACSEDDVACEASDIPDHDEQTIVIEGDPWSGYAPFRDPNLLGSTGYTPLYVEQLCQDMRAADLSDGRADIILTSLDQYLLHQPEGTIVGVIDQSLGADALVLNNLAPDTDFLQTVEDLPELVRRFEEDGKKPVLAYTGNSPSEMLLDELSNTYEELRLDDFELVAVDQSATAYEMLINDETQAVMLWEPDVSEAVAEGYVKALSSADVPDSIVDVIVASDQLLEEDEAAVRAVVSQFYGRMDTYLADQDALIGRIAVDGALSTEQAADIVKGITLYDTAGANAFMNQDEFPLDRPRLEQSIDSIGSLLALVHPGVDPERAKIDGRYVEELLQ